MIKYCLAILILYVNLILFPNCFEIPNTLYLLKTNANETLEVPGSVGNLLNHLRGRVISESFVEISCRKTTSKRPDQRLKKFIDLSEEELHIGGDMECTLTNGNENYPDSYMPKGSTVQKSYQLHFSDHTENFFSNTSSTDVSICYRLVYARCHGTKMEIDVTERVGEILSNYVKKFFKSINFKEGGFETDVILSITSNLTLNAFPKKSNHVMSSNIKTVISDPVCDISRDCPWIHNLTMKDIYWWAGKSECSDNDSPCRLLKHYAGTEEPILAVRGNEDDILTIVSPPIMGTGDNCLLNITYLLSDIYAVMVVQIVTEEFQWPTRLPSTESTWDTWSLQLGRIESILHVKLRIYVPVYNAFGLLKTITLVNCNAVQGNLTLEIPANKFKCQTGKLVSRDRVCDGIKDCIHGDDELPPACTEKSQYVCDFGNELCFRDYGNCVGEQMKAMDTKAMTDSDGEFNGTILVYDDDNCDYEGFDPKVVKLKTENFSIPEDANKFGKCVMSVSMFAKRYPEILVCDGDFVILEGWREVMNCKSLNYTKLNGERWHTVHINLEQILTELSLRNVTSYFMVFQITFFGTQYLVFDQLRLMGRCFANDDVVAELIPSDHTETILVIVCCAAVFILVVIAFVALLYIKPLSKKFTCLQKLRTKQKNSVTFEPYRLSYDAPLLSNMNERHPYYPWYHECTLTPSITEDIKDLSRCTIKIHRLLGRGAFGEVYEGSLDRDSTTTVVAVKKLPIGSSANDKKDFLLESFTISKFKHENIISCLGIRVHQDCPLLVLELMPGGDMKSFLRESRPTEGEEPMLSSSELITLASDIAHGCEYLESCKFIHRDIAARNCLLTSKGPDRVAKIADFGLARDVISTNYYRKCGRSALPVRWMPPESFRHGVFSTKSDVWAFGVLLWEIFSFGCVPYGTGLAHQMIMLNVENGNRLEQPGHCSDSVYAIMTDCWEPDSGDRPSFQTICQLLFCQQNGCLARQNKSRKSSVRKDHYNVTGSEDDVFEDTV